MNKIRKYERKSVQEGAWMEAKAVPQLCIIERITCTYVICLRVFIQNKN